MSSDYLDLFLRTQLSMLERMDSFRVSECVTSALLIFSSFSVLRSLLRLIANEEIAELKAESALASSKNRPRERDAFVVDREQSREKRLHVE